MDREQFIKGIAKEQNALRGFLLSLCCGDKDEADDIFQDSMLKAYMSIGGYSGRGTFRAWIFRIAYNTFLDRASTAKRNSRLEEVGPIEGHDTADAGFVRQELYMALRELPPKERSAITLHYLNGYSIKEISKMTGCSQMAVKAQMFRGRAKLKELIQR